MSQTPVRTACSSDLDAAVRLIEAKRAQYQQYQSRFWRKASNSAQLSLKYFAELLANPVNEFLVFEEGGGVNGFLIARPVPVPPVYEPGGGAALIDDFWVENPADWMRVGGALLSEANRRLKAKGITQVVVICGDRDSAKKEMLASSDLSIASTWWTKTI